MSSKRIVGLAVFALACAIAAEVIVEAGLTVVHGGHFPPEPGYKLLMGLLPIPVLIVAGLRYWRETEFESPKVLQFPVFAVLILGLILVVGGMFVERPGGVEARDEAPTVTPSVAPAVLPASGSIFGPSMQHYGHLLMFGGVLSRNSGESLNSDRKDAGRST